MKKLANVLASVGIFLAIFALVLEYTGGKIIGLEPLQPYAGAALFSASSLILVAFLVRFLGQREARAYMARDIRLFFWFSGIVLLLLLVFLTIQSRIEQDRQKVIGEFHKIYHQSGGYKTFYLGIQSAQYPADNWVMQEIISEIKPDFVVETGTAAGGTALFYADILEKVNDEGKVITVDIDPHDPKVSQFKTWRERVTYIRGSSVSPEVFDVIKKRVQGHRVIVSLDSLHWKPHVLKELELYSALIPVGSYIIVQDTQFTGHPIPEGSEGPWEAVEDFLKKNKDFIIDRSRERHLVTANPSGYLKRVR